MIQWKTAPARRSAPARFDLASRTLLAQTARNRVYQESGCAHRVKMRGAALCARRCCGRVQSVPQRAHAPAAEHGAPLPPTPGRIADPLPHRSRAIRAARSGLSRGPDGLPGPQPRDRESHPERQGWATCDGAASDAAFALDLASGRLRRRRSAGVRTRKARISPRTLRMSRGPARAHNMLGPAVLDAADFPAITTQCRVDRDCQAAFRGRASALEVAGHASTLVVPFMLEISPRRLVAHRRADRRAPVVHRSRAVQHLLRARCKCKTRCGVKFKFVAVRGV